MADDKARLSVSVEGDVTVVQLADRKILDEVSIMRIGESLTELVARNSPPKLVIDFTNVEHMSSSVLGMLITLQKRIREGEGELRLCCIQPTIYEVFVITRLNEIFQIHEVVSDALGSFAQ